MRTSTARTCPQALWFSGKKGAGEPMWYAQERSPTQQPLVLEVGELQDLFKRRRNASRFEEICRKILVEVQTTKIAINLLNPCLIPMVLPTVVSGLRDRER